MQELINKYFNELCKDKFFKNDDEVIIGKAKDVIDNLNNQIAFAKDIKNGLDEEDKDFIVDEATELIQDINNTYSNKDDVIEIQVNPMSGFYVLQNKESLFEELKEYYEELEEE